MNSTSSAEQGSSTRPYLIRALHEWCTDNGFTPYLAVYVDATVQVPREYVKNNEIVLNVGYEATSALQMGNEFIEFKARFGGSARDIAVPVDHVIAIYARENGQGMAFPVPASTAPAQPEASAEAAPARGGIRLAPAVSDDESMPEASVEAERAGSGADPQDPVPPAPGGGRPSLRRIK